MSALTLLALCNIGPKDSWSKAKRAGMTISKDIMAFTSMKYKKHYATNTRETFRRHVLHQFVQAKIADYNPNNPRLPTNSPKAHYAISKEALKVIRSWDRKEWNSLCEEFKAKKGHLLEIYQGRRKSAGVHVYLDGQTFNMSPGKHNEVQIVFIKEFIPRFVPSAKILYFGDTANKKLYLNKDLIKALHLTISEHDKLPDIILYDTKRKWIFLVEVVTFHGPMSPKRVIELREMFAKYFANLVFVSAFPDFETFRKHLKNIAWETEVWISEIPDHLIHYNGDKFLDHR
jgi:type II restriction enzyme